MNAINTYFIDVIKNHYCDFNGLATRKQFWMYELFAFILGLILFGLVQATGSSIVSIIQWIITLGLFLPGLGITVRRLHDTGRSGWWVLLAFIPILNIIGSIVVLVFLLLPSQK